MKFFYTALVCLLISNHETFAQAKIFTNREQVWTAYLNQTRFTEKSGLWVDLHWRLNDHYVKGTSQTIARFGYTYYLTDNTRLTAGYARVTQYSTTSGVPDVPEHRPWQQMQWFEKKSWYSLMQYLRLEQRYRRRVSGEELLDDYNFNFRLRYNVAMSIPLTQKQMAPKVPFIFLNDELHINFGKNIVNNYFDQNRLYAGIGYQFTPNLSAILGYMYLFQQLPAGNEYININSIRFFILHNMNLRSGERQ